MRSTARVVWACRVGVGLLENHYYTTWSTYFISMYCVYNLYTIAYSTLNKDGRIHMHVHLCIHTYDTSYTLWVIYCIHASTVYVCSLLCIAFCMSLLIIRNYPCNTSSCCSEAGNTDREGRERGGSTNQTPQAERSWKGEGRGGA